MRGYERSALTINFIRALIDGGFADLHHPEYWDMSFVRNSPRAAEYTHVVDSIRESLRFMESVTGVALADMNRVDFYTSHEGLLLPYEQAQTRRVPRRDDGMIFAHISRGSATAPATSTERTSNSFAEYKIRLPSNRRSDHPEEVVELCRVLNPANEPGKLTLIHRFGATAIEAQFPPIIEAVQKAGRSVLWCCDPMHSNTETTASGVKTRRFEKILAELEKAFLILIDHKAHLGGVHFELTGENVTECLGGASGVTEADLAKAYRTPVDPRLNGEQALEMAFLLARLMARNREQAK